MLSSLPSPAPTQPPNHKPPNLKPPTHLCHLAGRHLCCLAQLPQQREEGLLAGSLHAQQQRLQQCARG